MGTTSLKKSAPATNATLFDTPAPTAESAVIEKGFPGDAPDEQPMFFHATAEQAEKTTESDTHQKGGGGGKKEVLWDLYTSDSPLSKISLQNGRNIVRPIAIPRSNSWFKKLWFYIFESGDEIAIVCPRDGQDIIKAAQIALYENPETVGRMRTGANKEGFKYQDKRRSIFLVSPYTKEEGLTGFGFLSVPVSKESRKGKNGTNYVPKPQWGDRLIELPALRDDLDEAKYKYGVVFCPQDGRLINLVVSNGGKPEMDVTVTPLNDTFPLGYFHEKVFTVDPKYSPLLSKMAKLSPDLHEIINYAPVETQLKCIEKFTPDDLLPVALKAAQEYAAKLKK